MPLILLKTLKNTSFIIFSEKRNICNFTEKVSFHRKNEFFDDSLLISLFSSNNKQRTLNIARIYFFSEKKINDVFFNVFRSINGILKKTPIYKYNICNLNKEENSDKKVTFSSFFSYFHIMVEENQKNTFFISTIFFSLKLHKIPIFMFLSLYYDNILIFL